MRRFPVQTSLYGASKLAAEGLIAAYCEGFGFQGFIFRFVSILGERYTHGHVFDFYQKLLADPSKLEVLGNGKQRKSYLYIQDCLDAILIAIERPTDRVNIFNLGPDEYCEVNRLDRLDLRAPAAEAQSSNTPAAIAAGSATIRSSFSIAAGSARWAGCRSCRSGRA